MRRVRLSFDLWLTIAITAGFVWIAGFVYSSAFANIHYESYLETKNSSEAVIGTIASSNYINAQSKEDLLLNETFTLFLEGGDTYDISGAMHFYTDFGVLRLYELPSGETVLVFANLLNSVETDNGLQLPVGTFIEYDLVNEEKNAYQQFLQISDQKLTIVDGYIDMFGDTRIKDKEAFIEDNLLIIQAITFVIIFVLLRFIGAKLGLFRSIFALSFNKKKEEEQNSDWD